MEKVMTMTEAMDRIKDGMSIMFGGFLAVGTPERFIDVLIEKGIKDLTIITTDTGFPDKGTGRLIVNKQVKKVIASHIGTNPETGRQMNSGEMEVELVPQGTLAERIRAAGAGLGGVITPTGVGTILEESKQKITLDGKDYLIEMPLRADVALIKGARVDKKGNVTYNNSARNFNPVMAMAADLVIVQADEIVEAGEINPNDVVTPGIFVDIIVKGV